MVGHTQLGGESIGVIGGGYVGLVTGACFAALGFDVTIVEADSGKLESLKKGKVPIYEPGLGELVTEGIADERLRFVGSANELFSSKDRSCEIVFIAVGTPQADDGRCDLSYVNQAVEDVLKASKNDLVVVLKSTVPVGTALSVAEKFKNHEKGRRLAVVNNPEFLKEGSAVQDFMRPDRVVLGSSQVWATEKVKALYDSLLNNGHPLFVTDHQTAELSKLASNLMLACRISLVNQIAQFSDKTNANIRQVESIMRSDPRIGPRYLYSGLGYGGSCFPKDVKSFIYQCQDAGVDASMAKAVDHFNANQKLFFLPHIQKAFPKASGIKVALLGVAFKPNTDDIRESPALDMTLALSKLGYSIQAYDPKALNHYESWVKGQKISGVKICPSLEDCVSGADIIVLVTEWQEFQRLQPSRLRAIFKGTHLFDGKNILKGEPFEAVGISYRGVGRK